MTGIFIQRGTFQIKASGSLKTLEVSTFLRKEEIISKNVFIA
jgi:hypothetical protein